MQTCSECQTENADDAARCVACGALMAEGGSPHQSFARRLAELQDTMVGVEPVPGRVSEERKSFVIAPTTPSASARVQATTGRTFLSTRREDLLEHAIEELERLARVSFYVSLVIYVTLASLMLLAGLFFLVALLFGADWKLLVASGAAAAIAFLSLFLVQLSPLGRRQNRQAVLLAQTEAARRSLAHSLELWDGYLEPRLGKLKPEEMALAVESLAKSSEVIISNLASLTAASSPSGSPPPPQRKGPADPAVAAKY